MRVWSTLLVSLLAAGCGSATTGVTSGTGGSGGGGGGGPAPLGPASAPVTVASDAIGIVGVTGDGQALYRNADSLVAVSLDDTNRSPRTVSKGDGTVQIHGSVVFNYANIDWTTNLGDLGVWDAASGAHSIGRAAYGESMAVASADGSHIAYLTHVSGTSADLVLATPDLATQKVLIPGVGLGSQKTCNANFGFVGQTLVASWCKPGSLTAELDRFNAPAYTQQKIATDVQSGWSADKDGKRIVYVDNGAKAFFAEGGQTTHIDDSVGWAMVLPDGSAALYTVSDQLRRSPLPDISAIPIVTNKFVSRAALSPDDNYALFSTVIDYTNGTHQDLRLAPTDKLTVDPLVMAEKPTAEIPDTPFTRDSKWALYLTNGANGSKTLHMQPVDGKAPITVDGVGAIVAAHDSRVVYSHNLSDPNKYPVTADLAVIDPALPGGPVELDTGTTDGRSFEVTPDGKRLVFMKPNKSGAADVMVQDIP